MSRPSFIFLHLPSMLPLSSHSFSHAFLYALTSFSSCLSVSFLFLHFLLSFCLLLVSGWHVYVVLKTFKNYSRSMHKSKIWAPQKCCFLLLLIRYPFSSAVKRTLCRPIRLPMCSANANTWESVENIQSNDEREIVRIRENRWESRREWGDWSQIEVYTDSVIACVGKFFESGI